MTNPEIYFHVGLPKTGSTFLQRKVFPKFGNIYFVKKHRFKYYNNILDQGKHNKILFSTELNIGKPHTDQKIIKFANRCPDAKTIIVLRRQDKWLRSKYKYHIRKNGTLNFDEFFNFDNTGKVKLKELNFMSKIEFLQSQFSKPPLIIFQEEIANAPHEIFNLLADEMNATIEGKISTKKLKSAYNQKQLKRLLHFNKKHPYKNPPQSSTKLRRKLYKKYTKLIIHSVAYFAQFLAETKEGELIPAEKLMEVKDYYKEDWNKVLNYASQQRKLYISNS
jgi:hypothetical protein